MRMKRTKNEKDLAFELASALVNWYFQTKLYRFTNENSAIWEKSVIPKTEASSCKDRKVIK